VHSLGDLFEAVPLDDGFDGGNVLGLVHAVRTVVHLDDLDLIPVLNHLEGGVTYGVRFALE